LNYFLGRIELIAFIVRSIDISELIKKEVEKQVKDELSKSKN